MSNIICEKCTRRIYPWDNKTCVNCESLPLVEKILCAAYHINDGIQYDNMPYNISEGFVITGYRHDNCLSIYKDIKGSDVDTENTIITAGFLTNKNRFLNRVDAAKVAFNAGQIKEPVSALISELLY